MTNPYKGGFVFAIPRALRKIRRLTQSAIFKQCLQLSGARIGTRSTFGINCFIDDPRSLSIGNFSRFGKSVIVTSELPNSELILHNNIQINDEVTLDHTGGLEIEDDVLISEGSIIYTHDHGHNPRSSPEPLSKIIHKNTWIGARVIITSKCRAIGPRSIIGTGSVVTRDVPPNVIVAGNPAKIIGRLEQ